MITFGGESGEGVMTLTLYLRVTWLLLESYKGRLRDITKTTAEYQSSQP